MIARDTISIGRRRVGVGQPCYIIAEIGINHNGNLALGTEMVAAAAAAGADAVKFQNYRTEDFLSDRTLTHTYVSRGVEVEESQFDLFKRCELTREDLVTYRQIANEHGLDFISTPTSSQGVSDLVGIGAAALKNGSDYLGHLPLIASMAATGLPTIVSVGMATLEEIEDAVAAFKDAGGRELVLLHCVSRYPAPMSDLNLRKIPSLHERMHCPIGYSDHAEGIAAATTAVALGACMLEKHFTLDRSLPGPDHAMSCDPAELTELVAAVRRVETALGDGRIEPAACEASARLEYRLSCVAAQEFAAGHVMTDADIAFRRPGHGLRPSEIGKLTNRSLVRPVQRGHVFHLDDVAKP